MGVKVDTYGQRALTLMILLWTLAVHAQEEGAQDDHFPHDCQELMKEGNTESGEYTIYPGEISAPVYCDMDTAGGGWTVIQRHRDGSTDFERDWSDYSRGFGGRSEDFWLGNRVLYRLTRRPEASYRLRIEIEDWSTPPVKKYAEYSNFRITPEETFHTLTFSNYSGTAGDSMRFHNNAKFSTSDLDKDQWHGGSYATVLHSGWWFGSAVGANLNGKFYPGRWDESRDGPYEGGIWWTTMKGFFDSVRSEMKIRDDNPSTGTTRRL